MVRIVVPVFARPAAFAGALPEIMARVGCEFEVYVVVDGDPATPWHAVHANTDTADRIGVTVITLGTHIGNGAALARGCVGATGPVIKVDADVIPSPDYGSVLSKLAESGPPDVGCYVGLPRPAIPRHDAGLRRIPQDRVIPLRVALFTPTGLAALGDHATTAPLGEHDILVMRRLAAAGLRRVYTHLAWVDRHIEMRDADYDAWAAPYRQSRQRAHITAR